MDHVMSDEELLRKFTGGDDDAFAELYHRHKHAVYGFCLRMLGDRDGAEDIVQSVFVRIFQRRERLQKPGAFRAWIFTIARNECISYFRITGRYDPMSEDVTDSGGTGDPLVEVQRGEESELLASALTRLKPFYREVVVLRDYQGLTYLEISGIIGEPESVVKSRLYTARRQLFDLLKPFFLERE